MAIVPDLEKRGIEHAVATAGLERERRRLRRLARDEPGQLAVDRWAAVRDLILAKEYDVDRMQTELQWVATDEAGKMRRESTETTIARLRKELEALVMELPQLEAALRTATG